MLADEPEPTNADLLNAFRAFTEQVLAQLAEIRQQLGGVGSTFDPRVTPEPLPDGLDEAPPMRGFLLDDEDGLQ